MNGNFFFSKSVPEPPDKTCPPLPQWIIISNFQILFIQGNVDQEYKDFAGVCFVVLQF